MNIQTLEKHLLTLVTLGEADAPVVSCYLNLEAGLDAARQAIDERVRLLRKSLPQPQRELFEQAFTQIHTRLAAGFLEESLGVAVFSRGGAQEFFLDLEFRVPLPSWISVNSTPNIYHLVELKDTYDRYVVVIANDHNTRVLEVHLGTITDAMLAERPELQDRVGRGWSRDHYQSNRREHDHQFANEVVRIAGEVMATGKYRHLVLAGTPRMTALLRQALPKQLESKLIDVVPASDKDRTRDVVAATLASFIEEEQQESLAAVEMLEREIRRHGLAVAGAGASLQALKNHQVDLLVMATEYVPEPAWTCAECDVAAVQQGLPAICPSCGSSKTRRLDVKEELARLAELGGCGIEIVHDSEILMQMGGVGCLLRFLTSDAVGLHPAVARG
ncbi:MAG: host attachment protein [Bryobacterales bacterium]|nr:host attachment protein [Bryobacterales bacterium]